MEDKRHDDMRFLFEDTALDDLFGELVAEETIGTSLNMHARETPTFFSPLEATNAPNQNDRFSLGTAKPAFSSDGDGDASSETASQASSDTNVPVRKKPMTNSTRERMKQELSYLREKVVELEQQLETAKRSAATMTAPSTNGQENDQSLVNVQCSLWERVARHQRVEKQKAERKNAELRMLLEDQIKIARSLEKALRKRPSAMLSTSLIDELDVGLPSKRTCADNPQDPSIFARLTERADRSYQELAAIWRRTGFDTNKAERNESEVLVDSSNRLYLEVTTAKIVPFSMQMTDCAAWACISQPKLKFMNGIYHGVKATPNTIHSNSEMWMRVGNEEAHMQMAIVTKRFEENGRIVYVLESSAIGGGSRDLLKSVQIVEKGWVVLEPVQARTVTNIDGAPGAPEAAPMESSILQVCMRLMPAVGSDLTTKPGGVTPGALTDLILGVFRQNLGFLFQTIENMLVEQMLTMGTHGDVKKNLIRDQ